MSSLKIYFSLVFVVVVAQNVSAQSQHKLNLEEELGPADEATSQVLPRGGATGISALVAMAMIANDARLEKKISKAEFDRLEKIFKSALDVEINFAKLVTALPDDRVAIMEKIHKALMDDGIIEHLENFQKKNPGLLSAHGKSVDVVAGLKSFRDQVNFAAATGDASDLTRARLIESFRHASQSDWLTNRQLQEIVQQAGLKNDRYKAKLRMDIPQLRVSNAAKIGMAGTGAVGAYELFQLWRESNKAKESLSY